MKKGLKNIILKAFLLDWLLIVILVNTSAILLYDVFHFSLSETIFAQFVYVYSFYSLTVLVIWIVNKVRKARKEGYLSGKLKEHEMIRAVYENKELKFFLLFVISAPINIIYSIYKLVLGGYLGSWWILENGLYGIITTAIRLILFSLFYKGGEIEKKSLKVTTCAMPFLILIYMFMFADMLKNSSFHSYPGHLIYLEALYVFTKMGTSIKWFVRKTHSPALSAARILKVSQALVSIIFLAGSMLFTFSQGGNEERVILIVSGGSVLVLLISSLPFLIREERRLSLSR